MSKMPDKRKPPSTTGSSPYAKRTRPSYAEHDDGDDFHKNTPQPYERPRNDPVYGQKSAFPGLDDPAGDELFYGPAEDGIEYLRMVRSEANSLPSFFAAKTSVMTRTDEEPTAFQGRKDANNYARGIYSDGVYDNLTSSTQEAYYNLLRHRFLLLRSTLRCAPPASAIAALDDSHPITLPRGSRSARKEWRRLLLSVDPQMVQLACMDMDTVLSVLGIMARLMSENVRSGDAEKVRRISAWAWGLLGKCREVGQLGTEEVGEIRDLGKRAAKILLKMKEDEDERSKIDSIAPDKEEEESVSSSDDQEQPLEVRDGDSADDENDNIPEPSNSMNARNAAHASDYDSDMPDAEPETEPERIPPSEELDAAKARLQAQLRFSHSPEQEQQQIETDVPEDKGSQDLDLEAERAAHAADVVKQTRAMLDMIITVVGEYYGQRDLLAAREIWEVSL